MPDIVVDRTTYIKIGNAEPITTGIAEGSMLIDRVLFVDDFRFGQFASSRFEIQVYGLSNVAKQKIEVYQMSNNTRTDLFVGEIESSKLDNAGYYRDIIAYDMFYFIARKDVSNWFNGLWTNNVTQVTILDAFKSLLTYFNLSYDTNTVNAANFTGTLYKDSIVEFEKISFKDMVKYMLEPLALIPYIDASGKVAVYSPSMASGVDLASKYDKNASVFEEYEVQPMQWVGIVDIDNAVIQQAEISGNTSDIRYDLPYNPLRLDLYSEDGSAAKTAVLNDFITKANFAEYTPCEVTMIVSDMSIKLGDKITTARGTSYVSEITLSGPMLVEQQLISRGSPIQQEVEEDYDPVFSYLSNKITENENELANLQDEIDNYEPSEEYTNKVSEFSSIIAGGMGLKSITYKQQDGSYVKYYYAPATAQSTSISGSHFVFTMKSSGFAWTDNWQGTADASSEGNTVWISGFSANGNALLKMLSVYKLTADQINAGAITVGGLGQDVLNLIEQGSDGIDVHATAGTISTNNYPLTTTEQVTELTEGQTVEITFPNGIDFTLNTSGSTYLYKPRTVSIGNNTYTLLNANGTTDWCNVKSSTDYSSGVMVKFVLRNSTAYMGNSPALCEYISVDDVVDRTLENNNYPTILKVTEAVSSAASGTVLKCDVSQLTYGMGISSSSASATSCNSPQFSWDRSNYKQLLSKSHYAVDKGLADAYSASDLYMTGQDGSTADYTGASSSSGSGSVKTVLSITPSGIVVANNVTIDVTFSNANTASYPELSIEGAPSKQIVVSTGSGYTSNIGSSSLNWGAGQTRRFTYKTSIGAFSNVWLMTDASSSTTYYFTPKTEAEPTGISNIYLILENLRTSDGSELRAFELAYEPYSTAPIAIDQTARDAADLALAAATAAASAASDAQDAVDALDSDVDSRISSAIAGVTVEGTVTTFYGTCSTGASTVEKAVATDNSFALTKGAIVNVNFTYENTADNPTLNINSTGAKAIYVNNARLRYGTAQATNAYNWTAGAVVQFMYDGSYWRMSQTSADLILAKWCANNDITKIDGGKIYTGSVAADSIASNAITTVKLNAGAVTAEKITASNTMLENLLAKTATITGNLKIVQDYFTSSSSTYTTELTATKNAYAIANGYSSYDNIPNTIAGNLLKSLIDTMAAASVYSKHYLSNMPFKVYIDYNGTEVPVAGLNAVGLIVAPRDSDGLNGSITRNAEYGINAKIPGNLSVGGTLTVNGEQITPGGSGGSIITEQGQAQVLFSNGLYTGLSDNISFSSSFSSQPKVFLSVECADTSGGYTAHIKSISSSGFSICAYRSTTLGGNNVQININWFAVG